MAGTVSSGASNPMLSTQSDNPLKHASNNVGWEYGVLADPSNSDKVKCKLCKKVLSGGIYRMKQHIAHIKGNVAGCTKSLDEDIAKCKAALNEAKKKKKERNMHYYEEVREEVHILKKIKILKLLSQGKGCELLGLLIGLHSPSILVLQNQMMEARVSDNKIFMMQFGRIEHIRWINICLDGSTKPVFLSMPLIMIASNALWNQLVNLARDTNL
ncbi:hypothetical protein ACFX1S_046919 [Malus domestica]